ncbi:MAG: hypothetical protein GXP50_05885 [Deltaproteobacteria bacterium]|nr:hypothetical protein [Deltaproteobacteria bacterium]
MRIDRRWFALLVVAVFVLGMWGFRALGVWRPRTRRLPPAERLAPAPAAPGESGAFPM